MSLYHYEAGSRNYGRMAAAPVLARLGLNRMSSMLAAFAGLEFGVGGGSMIGRPAAIRCFFHRCQGEPPAMSMSSWKMFDDHFLSILIVFVEPFSMATP